MERAEVRAGVTLAWDRAGHGGQPLVLVHGWPATRRNFARTVAPLAAAGFDVVVPDLRGFGDSGPAPDGAYDVAAHARDLFALLHDVLGFESVAAAGGDLGLAVIVDLGLRFEGFVERACVWNGPLPWIGGPPELPPEVLEALDYFVRQGRDADALMAELDTAEARLAYVARFYGDRGWAAPGAFSAADVAWLAEPFADAAALRASFANYESALGTRPRSERPRFDEPFGVPTLVLHGPEDRVVPRDWASRAERAFPDRCGPFVVPGAGHFLEWERADVLAGALRWFLRDLTERRRRLRA